MSKKFFLWLALIFFASTPLHNSYAALPSIEAYENKEIGQIDIRVENLAPDGSFDSKALLTRLKTKVGDPFSQLTFDTDLKALAEEYDRIEPSVTMQEGKVAITLKLWIRPTIRSIQWEGNTHIKTKKLQSELDIKEGTIFNRSTFNKAFNKVKEFYVKKGYFESQLQYSIKIDPKTNAVDVLIQVNEGRSGQIDNIVFSGFTDEERSQLLSMIHTKKYNLFSYFVFGTGMYNEEALEQDKLTIVNFFQNKGYADAKVAINVKESKSEGRIILEVTVDRGVPFHFGEVTFYGNTLFKDAEIEKMFLVHPEELFSPEKLNKTAQAIKEMYGRKGYIDANVQYETTLMENAPVYNVHFDILEGEQYKIGLIHVFGNVNTKTSVILHESHLIPGETFDSLKLKATQQRLENIGFFKNVNVYAVRTQDDQCLGENYRDVYIEVEETSTGNLSLFFGFSSADELFGGLDLAESNFNYRGIPQIFKKGLSALRGGGEYAHARFSLGQRQESFSISWLTPYFRDTLWRVGFDLNQTHSTLQTKHYAINTLGGSIYAAYPLTPYWTFGTKYRVRDSHVDVKKKHTSEAERDEEKNNGWLSAVSASIAFDSTDSALKPHNGFRSVLEGEFAGLGGKDTFFKFGYTNAFYTYLWRRGVMKYRWDFRALVPVWKTPRASDIPLSELFFLGGENSVRGYKAFDLGPHFKKSGDPKGGITASVLSVEYQHEIFSFLDGFIFADAGSVSRRLFNLRHYNLSYGFGARVELINRVPLTLGMGFPVNPDSHHQVERFFFSMGGQF